MQASILATKLFVPRDRPNWVVRPRLLQKLNASLSAGCKLTLVSAPAGFGKTTLLTGWLNALPAPSQVAWLSFDGGDNDLVSFLNYLIAAPCQPPTSRLKKAPTALWTPSMIWLWLTRRYGFPPGAVDPEK